MTPLARRLIRRAVSAFDGVRGLERLETMPFQDEGFGFDPVFVPRGETRTVAELGDDWKAEHSHRAVAARALLDTLS